MNGRNVLVLVGMMAAGLPSRVEAAADSETSGSARAAAESFSRQFPQARLYRTSSAVTRVYGTAVAFGSSPQDSAGRFVADHAGMWNVDPADLRPASFLADRRHTQGVMFDRQTATYKFTLVYYSQYRNGLPVLDSDIRLLVRNEPGYPLVLVTSGLRDLGGFAVEDNLLNQLGRGEFVQGRFAAAKQAVWAAAPSLVHFTQPQVVIWAGDGPKTQPRVALTFSADNFAPNQPSDQKWRYVTDLSDGTVLQRDSHIHEIDVAGTVSALATPGGGAEQCAAEVVKPMPYARVNIGGSVAFADVDGNFIISNLGSAAVMVDSAVRGEWFQVFNAAGSDAALSQRVTPPGPADFLHNADNSDPLRRAEVNAYIESNVVRDMVISHNPAYPTLQDQEFEVVVNRTDFVCPANAWYDDTVPSINFCQEGGGAPNTAWSSVVYHEYGHHLVNAAGSGQGQFGEGTGDVMSVVILDDPRLGQGFDIGDCVGSLRSADNDVQYPCTGSSHACGNLISGCVWDTRNELVVTEPADYLEILQNLAVNSILLHNGSTITPQIYIDWLTLDDDDADLGNGTPHSPEITAGFEPHSMVPLPAPDNDNCSNAIEACDGPVSGQTFSATTDGNATCGDSGGSPDVWYTYTPSSDGLATFSLCGNTGYDSVLSVHSGCPGGVGNNLACDDDSCAGGGPSEVTLNVVAGNTYLVRVTGWQGAVGNFTLNITGPVCGTIPLLISLPDGLPENLPLGGGSAFPVLIEAGNEVYEPGTATLHYRYDGGTFLTAPLTPMGGDSFEATLPPPPNCAAAPEYYISAEGDGGSVRTHPTGAPSSVHTALVGTLTVDFEDHFEADSGWTVVNSPGLTDGPWDRGAPVGGGDRGDPAADADGSGQCYLTDNVDENSDVDGGSTTLTSPVMDASGGTALLSYDRWFHNSFGAAPFTDVFVVQISDDGGQSWATLESVGPAGPEVSGGWFDKQFILNDVAGFTPNDQFRVRFVAEDTEPGSVVEAGVDGVRLAVLDCTEVGCPGDLTGNNTVDAGDLAMLLGAWGVCPGCPADLNGDNLVDAADLAMLLGAWGACE